jgi:hypothetical protein
MNYRQQLIHEALEELRSEDRALFAHVTDITCDWSDQSKGVRYWLVYKGAAYIIKRYDQKYWLWGYLSLWGLKDKTSDRSGTNWRITVDYIKDHIKATIRHAEETFPDRCGQYHIYPGLA